MLLGVYHKTLALFRLQQASDPCSELPKKGQKTASNKRMHTLTAWTSSSNPLEPVMQLQGVLRFLLLQLLKFESWVLMPGIPTPDFDKNGFLFSSLTSVDRSSGTVDRSCDV